MECDAKGVAADPARCTSAGVRRYPTWVVGKNRHEGLLTLDELARLSNFQAEPTASR